MSEIFQLIGNTPLVKITSIDTGLCNLYLKLECQNPGGSIKDRIALSMIRDAEEKGLIQAGSTLIEATAGNTGLGLALVAGLKGYKLILVIPDKMSREKITHLRALGAKVILVPSNVGKGHPDYYQDKAEKLASEIPGSFYVNQFENPANPLAHETTTGPEIFAALEGKVDAVVCGVGSAGTISGLSRFFRKMNSKTEMVLADPEGSILADFINIGTIPDPGSWVVEGIGEDFIPSIADFQSVKKAYSISDKESLSTARLVLEKEGILAGSSSGTLIAAALQYCKEQKEPKNVVTFVCDTGNKYLNKFFDDNWLVRWGYSTHKESSPQKLMQYFTAGGDYPRVAHNVKPIYAYNQMRIFGTSVLAVFKEETFIGILRKSDMLHLLGNTKEQTIENCIGKAWVEVSPKENIENLKSILLKGKYPVVFEGDRFLGIIREEDVLDAMI